MGICLILSDLSPDDNGRVIVCSAENVVGKNEASLQLDIHCKAWSVATDSSVDDANHLPSTPNLPSRSFNCFLLAIVISTGNTSLCALFSLLSPGKSYCLCMFPLCDSACGSLSLTSLPSCFTATLLLILPLRAVLMSPFGYLAIRLLLPLYKPVNVVFPAALGLPARQSPPVCSSCWSQSGTTTGASPSA